MDIPHFIQHPPTEAEMKSFLELAKGKSAKEIPQAVYRSVHTVEAHNKSMRFKFHSKNAVGAFARMVALGYITRNQLIELLPASWLKYVRS